LRDRYDREARVVCFRENKSGKLRALGGASRARMR
jgi:hypothetical protein